ncbi:hypothetical protein LOY55_14730 [Pseudomonas sp. B21-040]|nr:hypothetical protein [Pseudomonas sp. B21-040]UVL43263.1 hypothetical protein LOY55_14730 [Pseudomonas sp. B21-040]
MTVTVVPAGTVQVVLLATTGEGQFAAHVGDSIPAKSATVAAVCSRSRHT